MRLRFVIILWILAVVLSTGYRVFRGVVPPPQEDQLVYVAEVAPSVASSGRVRLAYRDLNPQKSGVPILLLHGNPMAGRAMLPLATALGEERRILIPDLPGLGFTERNLVRYSAENQVMVLLDWMDTMGLDQVHVVGYSQGSAVALELANSAPLRMVSVTFIAGVGLQEYELLGRYEWNQPIYTAYRGLLLSLRWLTPHFGYFDAPMFGPTTAQNFADTDLRRNESILGQLNAPALILHAVDDRLVPFAAAQAHAMLLPQADFYELPGGHLGLFSDTELYADALNRFIEKLEARTSMLPVFRLGDQPAAGIQLSATPSFIQDAMLATLLFIFVFFSEDLACIAGGILAASGVITLPAAIVGCFLGIFVSDLGLYLIGRILGGRALRLSFVAKASEGSSFTRLRSGYERSGFKVVFLTRFIPGSRVIAYITAGVMKLPFPRFCLWLAVAAAVWTPILVSVAYFVGQPLMQWWERSGVAVLPLIALGLVGLYVVLHLLTQSLTYRGRRSIRGRWVRLTQWEFWPALPVYLPVFFYGCWLAVRYRSATVWATCNPGMSPASGLALESKSDILAALNPDADCVADWVCIQPSGALRDRLQALFDFQEAQALTWPLVLKPDIGQRGEGVAVIHDQAQAEFYLRENSELVIAQRFIAGAEFGVFYVREPGEKSRLFSITEKRLPELLGDGVRTVESLILDDARAVALAKHYLKVNGARLSEVPEDGARIQLVELGTHCRGAIFLDGNRYKSEALRLKLDELLATYEGFYFGRFDLRVPSGEMMAQGEGIRVLELNGVSSESTDIYDPKNSILQAWRVLRAQWALAFRIGAANRAKGASVPTVSEIVSVLRGHRARSPYEVSSES